MLRSLQISEVAMIGGGYDSMTGDSDGGGGGRGGVGVNIDVDASDLIGPLQDFGNTISNWWNAESRVSSFVTGLDSNWTTESNGWLYDSNNDLWAVDYDGDRMWDHYGRFDGCVFEYTDGRNVYSSTDSCP